MSCAGNQISYLERFKGLLGLLGVFEQLGLSEVFRLLGVFEQLGLLGLFRLLYIRGV